MNEELLRIQKMVAEGKITPDESIELLESVLHDTTHKEPPVPAVAPPRSTFNCWLERIWPPMVVRRNGQAAINWPAVAMRGLRSAVLICAFGIGIWPHGQLDKVMAEWLCILLFVLLVLVVGGVRILRGFSMPVDRLPAGKGETS
jgi:hypothetical protein